MTELKPSRGPSFSKLLLARGVLGDMLVQRLTPQGLEGVTAAVHGIQLRKLGMLATMIAPADPVGGDARVGFFLCLCFGQNNNDRFLGI